MSVRARVIAVGVLLAFFAVTILVDEGPQQRSGPSGSSESRGPDGVSGWATLLERAGHEVRRVRDPPGDRRLDPSWTAIAVDPGTLPSEDREELERFVRAGGRLIAAGEGAEELAFGASVTAMRDDGPGSLRPLAPAPELASVRRIDASGEGTFTSAGTALPVLGGSLGIGAVALRPGEGRVIALADASPLRNDNLDAADNAAFALGLGGAASREIAFLESLRGLEPESGLGALPDGWSTALLVLLLAVALWVGARFPRLGPPALDARPLPPPRRDYVEAMTTTLARTGDLSRAGDDVRAAARERLARRAGLGPDPSPAALREAAARYGLDDEAAAALAGERDSDLLAAGRALAQVDVGSPKR